MDTNFYICDRIPPLFRKGLIKVFFIGKVRLEQSRTLDRVVRRTCPQ